MALIDLWATDGYISTPNGQSVYVWGLSRNAASPAQLPAPTLVVGQGDPVTVNLTNHLTEPVSLRFPGQSGVEALAPGSPGWEPARPQYDAGRLVSLVQVAGPGETVGYRFVPNAPGTFVYESGTNPQVQVPMGLAGALIVRPLDFDPVANRTAYGAGTGTAYDREYLLVTGEIDPDMHLAVAEGRSYDVRGHKPRFWTLNGRSAPDTMVPDHAAHLPNQPYGAMIQAEPGEKILLRYAGGGLDSHPLHPHGNHARVVALDGRLLRNGPANLSHKRFTVLLGAGQTCDLVYDWTGLGYDPTHPIPTRIPDLRNLAVGDAGWTLWSGSAYLGRKGDLPMGVTPFNEAGEYHFMLHSHEEPQITNWGEFPGGMMTMIAISPPGALGSTVGTLG